MIGASASSPKVKPVVSKVNDVELLNRLLARTPEEALAAADVVVVASSDPGLLAALLAATDGDAGPRQVIDLHGKLGDAVEKIDGYEGVGW